MSVIPIILGLGIGVSLTVYLFKTFGDNDKMYRSKYSHIIGMPFHEAVAINKDIILVEYRCGLPPNLSSRYTPNRLNVRTNDDNIITEIISCG